MKVGKVVSGGVWSHVELEFDDGSVGSVSLSHDQMAEFVYSLGYEGREIETRKLRIDRQGRVFCGVCDRIGTWKVVLWHPAEDGTDHVLTTMMCGEHRNRVETTGAPCPQCLQVMKVNSAVAAT